MAFLHHLATWTGDEPGEVLLIWDGAKSDACFCAIKSCLSVKQRAQPIRVAVMP